MTLPQPLISYDQVLLSGTKRDVIFEDEELIFGYEKAAFSILDETKDGKSWKFSFGNETCIGFTQPSISADSFCQSWSYIGRSQSYFNFEMRGQDGVALNKNGTLSSCETTNQEYSLYAIDRALGTEYLLHKVNRLSSGTTSCIQPFVEDSTSGGSTPSTSEYTVTYNYQVGRTWSDYNCNTAGLNSFTSSSKTVGVTQSSFQFLSGNSSCSVNASNLKNLVCDYTANCTSQQAWCAKGSNETKDYRSGHYTLKVCTEPGF